MEIIHPVNLRRINHAANVLTKPENSRAARGFVASYAFENRAAVADDMRQNVNFRIVPCNKFAVAPDLLGGFHSISINPRPVQFPLKLLSQRWAGGFSSAWEVFRHGLLRSDRRLLLNLPISAPIAAE